MNAFAAALAELCATRRLEEKRVVAPSRRVGHQWLDAVARAGRPPLNARVETLRSLAVELAAPALAREGLAVAPRRAEELLVDEILHARAPGKLRYLGSAARAPGFAATLLSSLDDLRRQGIPGKHLRAGVFEDAGKAEDLRLLAADLERRLAAEGLADYARVLHLAAARLAADPEALGPGTLVVVPEDLAPSGLERRLLEGLAPGRLVRLAVDPPGLGAGARFSCAVGEANEVRGVLRACLERGLPLDEVEVLHTDPAYALALHEALAALDRPAADPADPADAPATFAEGLPCSLSRPGRALSSWLRWMGDGYRQGALVAMIREGLLTVGEEGGERAGFSHLARLLRTVPIGQGRERYLPALDARIAEVRGSLQALEDSPGEDGPHGGGEGGAREETAAERRERLEGTLGRLRTLHALVERLLALSPPEGAGAAALVGGTRRLLAECARGAGRFDAFAAEKLREEVEDTAHWLEPAGGGSVRDVRAWLEALPAAARVAGSGPRPGCLHVAHLRAGGHSGRAHTFILGLDDARFPGAGLQDPLLLDRERGRLDEQMPTAARRLTETLDDFARLLGRLRGSVTLSWPSRSVVEDAELFPSPAVLDAFRLARGAPEAELHALLAAAGTPLSFAPAAAAASLDLGEWWLWRFTGPAAATNAAEVLARRAPHLGRGLRAAAERAGAAFTAWDGRVPAAGAALDPAAPGGPVLSANGLETAGACPRRFFYHYALGIAPPDELVVDPERWLDPLATGSLLHELFEQYGREVVRAGRHADPERARGRILELLERILAEYRALHPLASPAAYASEHEQLTLAAETFVREEARYALAAGCEPAYLEASLGMPPGAHGTDLDDPEPIPVELPGGRAIRTRGRIDRVDRVAGGPGAWEIWDYKTGGTWGYDPADPFPEGRKIQPYLYLRMVERRLRAAVDPAAVVRRFGYFFPGAKGRGERIAWDAARLAAGRETLDALCRIIATGAYAATTDAETDCRHCDYRPACGDVAAQAAATVRKVLAGDPLLGPLGALRALAGRAVGALEEEG